MTISNAARKAVMADELRARVEDNTRDIALVRRDLAVVQTGLNQLGDTIGGLVKKIDSLGSSISDRGRYSIQDMAAAMQVIVLGFALISGVVSGIVYISGNATASEMALLKAKVAEMDKKVSK